MNQFLLTGDDRPLALDTALDADKKAFMLQFEHHVNALIRHYETVISHYHPE